jgi:hypothetical protein
MVLSLNVTAGSFSIDLAALTERAGDDLAPPLGVDGSEPLTHVAAAANFRRTPMRGGNSPLQNQQYQSDGGPAFRRHWFALKIGFISSCGLL